MLAGGQPVRFSLTEALVFKSPSLSCHQQEVGEANLSINLTNIEEKTKKVPTKCLLDIQYRYSLLLCNVTNIVNTIDV